MIRFAHEKKERSNISRYILEALPDWFGIEEPREQYIAESADQPFFVAEDHGKPVGFLSLKETGKSTVEIAVMGVLMPYHRQGIGRELFHAAKQYAKDHGYEFMQVNTVAMGHSEDYDSTNHFYLSLGFKEFEIMPTLWDEVNPCQIYVMSV